MKKSMVNNLLQPRPLLWRLVIGQQGDIFLYISSIEKKTFKKIVNCPMVNTILFSDRHLLSTNICLKKGRSWSVNGMANQ